MPSELVSAKFEIYKIHRYINTQCYSNHGYRDIMPAVKKNREKEKSLPVYDPTLFTRLVCIT